MELKEKVDVKYEKKTYPTMTFEQIKKMVSLMNQGISEEEAKERAMRNE